MVIVIVGRWMWSEIIKEQTEAAHLWIPAAGSVCLHLCASWPCLCWSSNPAASRGHHPFWRAVHILSFVLTSTSAPPSRSPLSQLMPDWLYFCGPPQRALLNLPSLTSAPHAFLLAGWATSLQELHISGCPPARLPLTCSAGPSSQHEQCCTFVSSSRLCWFVLLFSSGLVKMIDFLLIFLLPLLCLPPLSPKTYTVFQIKRGETLRAGTLDLKRTKVIRNLKKQKQTLWLLQFLILFFSVDLFNFSFWCWEEHQLSKGRVLVVKSERVFVRARVCMCVYVWSTSHGRGKRC